eukprot:2845746-Prymnesium_polylepis.2
MVATGESAAATRPPPHVQRYFDPPASLPGSGHRVGYACSTESRPRRAFGCRYARVSPLTRGCACVGLDRKPIRSVMSVSSRRVADRYLPEVWGLACAGRALIRSPARRLASSLRAGATLESTPRTATAV